MKKTTKIVVLIAAILAVFGLVFWQMSKGKPVNLNVNSGLEGDNNISLQVKNLEERPITITEDDDGNQEDAVLGKIPQLYVAANQVASDAINKTIESLPYVEDDEYGDGDGDYEEYERLPPVVSSDHEQYFNGRDFVAFEYQDKDVTSLIKIQPEIRGTWSAKSNVLIFTPEKDWLPDQKFTITIDKNLISPELNLKKNKLDFTTPKIAYTIKDLYLDKDITQKKKFDIIGQVKSNFPIDEANFSKKIKLTLDKQTITPQITFDKYKRYAFIKYENVNILPKEQIAVLEIKNNSESAKTSLQIPQESNFFKINNISAITEKNKDNIPEQLLVIDFSDTVAPAQLKDKVEAFLVKKGTKITQKVLNTAKKLNLQLMTAEQANNSIHSFKFDFYDPKGEYNIYVQVKPVILSQSGFKFTKEYTATLQVPQYPKELSIVGDGSILSLSGNKHLNFVSLGVDKFEVTLARILPSQINHLVSQTYGGMKSPKFINKYDFNEDNISEIFTKTLTVNSDYKTPNYSSVDLNEYLTGNKGLFLVTLKEKNDYSEPAKRLIMISDIGIIYKKFEDKTARLYAVSIAQEKPLVKAKVEVLALNGTVIKTLYTNDEGFVNIPDLSDFEKDKRPIAILVKTDKDFSYIPYEQYERYVNYSRFDTNGTNDTKDLDVFVWTDRGIYFPGEKVDFALISKNKTWTTTAGLPIRIKIVDPRGTKIMEKDFSLTEEGLTSLSHKLNKSAPIGKYSIDVYSIGKKDRLNFLNSGSFKVEEYEEDKLKVSSSIKNAKAKGWFLTKEPFNIDVNVQNMYGSPAADNMVKARVSVMPVKFEFAEYNTYKFYNELDENEIVKDKKIQLSPRNTDGQGNVSFEIDLNKYLKGTYKMNFYAEAFEKESSKSVPTSVSAFVSPTAYLVGYKTSSNLSFLHKDAEAKIDFIAINNNLEKISLTGLTLALKERNYVSALTKEYNGSYRYQSVLQEKEINKQNIDISKNGYSFDIPTDKPGNYALVLYNSDGEILMKTEYFIAGATNTSFNLEKNAELVISLDKKSFEPNEEITISLITPYTGVGLITLERDKVYASKWFTADTNSTVQKIKIPENAEGGVYLNIAFVRNFDSKEIFVSPFSYGVTYVDVTPKNKILNIDLNTPQMVQPGQKLAVKYKTSEPAKIILFGASEGILQVARYSTPNPLKYFFRKKSLEVQTYQTLDLLLPNFDILKQNLATGGDGAMSEMRAYSEYANEFDRYRLEPVAFWSGILQADKTEKTYTYTVPDYFNGSIRVMAVGVNSKTVGNAVKAVNVKSPVILNASAPRMAAPNDIFEVGLRIANEHEKLQKGNFEATIKTTDGLKILGDKTKNISVSYGEEKTLYFKVQALDKNFGDNEITLTVKDNKLKETYKTSYNLSVRPASPYKVTVNMGNALSKNFTIKDFVMRDLYSYRANRALELSQNPLILFLSLETFLKNYPYGCTEQLVSQIFPRLAHASVKGKEAKKQVQEELDTVLNKISVRQKFNGTFALWDNSYGDDELTMYVADMLLTAKDFNYDVPENILNKALNRIENYISRIPYTNQQAKMMAYGHYLLARNGESKGSYLASLDNYLETKNPSYKKEIEAVYLAAAYQMLQDKEKANKLIKGFETEKDGKYISYSDYDTTLTRNAKYLYLVAKYFPEKLKDKKEKELLKLMIRDIALNNYNTMSASYAMAALNEYAKYVKAEDAVFTVSCAGNNLHVQNGNIAKVTDIPTACKEFKASVNKDATLGNFWFFNQEGYDKQPAKKHFNGLEIYKELQDENGKPVKQVKAGEDLTVILKIKSLTGKTITNVAITDMFAGPFMLVKDSLQGHYTFAEPREDRLLLFGNYGTSTTTITYKVKVTNAGEFTVPAVFAEAMYNNSINASSEEGKIIVEKRN